MAVHRRRVGTGGLLIPGWLGLHFRGEIYQLGRLQFQRSRLGGRTGEAVRAAGLPLGPEDFALDVHVPGFLGPITPEACDRSLALAREFFARHFPEEPYQVATCHSWLLDPQLAGYLPKDSNIVRFQDRFRIAYEKKEAADGDPVAFVFGDPELPLDALPRRTDAGAGDRRPSAGGPPLVLRARLVRDCRPGGATSRTAGCTKLKLGPGGAMSPGPRPGLPLRKH